MVRRIRKVKPARIRKLTELWGRGSQEQSLLLESGWTNSTLDMKNLIGEASCRICQENFSTTITALTEPIDIYSEWIDECERVNTVDDDGVPVDDDDA
ncbi:transcription elongation factor 1 [Artemisia annua]|uniref:Transcription elongation factor 1 homolog n=1 Tax=Artemisia annua TaxID=35608 RepID=A0A2U1NT12_ARTAN|nr:transcription elongation factor 1 [Artemisia annua]